jgi:hypothetical protein
MKKYKVSGIENKKSYSGSDVFKYQATVMAIDEIDAILKWNDIYNKYYEMKSFNIMDMTNNKNIDLSIFEKTNNKIKQCN